VFILASASSFSTYVTLIDGHQFLVKTDLLSSAGSSHSHGIAALTFQSSNVARLSHGHEIFTLQSARNLVG
jgi:hypothetical protein